jgi:type I restriction enzyme S subunit
MRVGRIIGARGSGDRDKLGRGWLWNGELEECIHQNHVFRARLLIEGLQPKFISYHGNSFGQLWFLRTGKQSVNLTSINLTVLRQFPLPLLAEQEEIVTEVEKRLRWRPQPSSKSRPT